MQQIVLGTRQSASNAGRLWHMAASARTGGLAMKTQPLPLSSGTFDQAVRCSIALRSLYFVPQRGCSREPTTVITSSSPPKGGSDPTARHHAQTPARTGSARASKTDCKNYGLKPSASVRRLAVA